MADMLLTIQHNGVVFSPPVEDGVQIEWERTGTAGKLTFTTIKDPNGGMDFGEGDAVCFYYADKPIFMGYVFTKKRDRENRISVTCYDQIRYLKNKYTYVFENKTATQIIQSLCADFNLSTGAMDNTAYVIPAIAEENKAALDIALDVLEETLTNTGKMYVLYDEFGKLTVKNCENLISTTLIMEDTAENFDYSSSIDKETYNSIVLYYKSDDKIVQLYTASSPQAIKQWGTLRYFEEVKTPTIGQNKANALLKLYNKKTRELKVTGAFGDPTIRGGTMIPVKLNLGDIIANNYMLVEKVTHNFNGDHYTMDLVLDGYWQDAEYDVQYKTIGELPTSGGSGSSTTGGGVGGTTKDISKEYKRVTINCNGINAYAGTITMSYSTGGSFTTVASGSQTVSALIPVGASVQVTVQSGGGHSFLVSNLSSGWTKTVSNGRTVLFAMTLRSEMEATVKWVR